MEGSQDDSDSEGERKLDQKETRKESVSKGGKEQESKG